MADSTTHSRELEKLKADMSAVRDDISKPASSMASEAQHRACATQLAAAGRRRTQPTRI